MASKTITINIHQPKEILGSGKGAPKTNILDVVDATGAGPGTGNGVVADSNDVPPPANKFI